MAFDSSNFYNVDSMPPGKARYVYLEDDDDRETVMASGYFNNSDDDLNLAADDIIEVRGDEGHYTLRVDTVSAGTVTTELAGQPIWVAGEIASMAATTSGWALAPVDGVIRRVKVVNYAQPSDATTVGLELANTNVTDGGSADIVTIAASAAAGTVSAGEADAANAVSEGTAIEITCGGEGSTAGKLDVYIEILPA